MQGAGPLQRAAWNIELEWGPHRLGWQRYSGDKNKQSPAQVRGGIMSTTPIKVNDVLLKHIYWESGRQQLWDLAFGKATVNKTERWVAFIGFESGDCVGVTTQGDSTEGCCEEIINVLSLITLLSGSEDAPCIMLTVKNSHQILLLSLVKVGD